MEEYLFKEMNGQITESIRAKTIQSLQGMLESNLSDFEMQGQSLSVYMDDLMDMAELDACISPDPNLSEHYGAYLGFFATGFITDEMRRAWHRIADRFLEEERMLYNGTADEDFENMEFPFRAAFNPIDVYCIPVLGMALICAAKGSRYSKAFLTGLYKTYHKKEYDILKRLPEVKTDDIKEFADTWSKDKYGTDHATGLMKAMTLARISIMAQLMGIKTYFKGSAFALSFHELLANITQDALESAEKKAKQRLTHENAPKGFLEKTEGIKRQVMAGDWSGLEPKETESWEAFLYWASKITKELMDCGYMLGASLISLDSENIGQAINLLCLDYPELLDGNHDGLIIPLAVICYLTVLLGCTTGNYKRSIGVLLNVNTDEWKTWEKEGDGEIAAQGRTLQVMPSDDPVPGKLAKILDKAAADTGNNGKTKKQPKPEIRKIAPPVQTDAKLEEMEKKYRELEQKIKAKERKIKELEGKLTEQRDKVKSLEKENNDLYSELEGYEETKTERDALKEELFSPDKEERAVATKEEMLSFLYTKRILIVGGNESCTAKLRRVMPNWDYVGPGGEGASGPVRTADRIYFFTDYMSHLVYDKYVMDAARAGTPFGYLHAVNTDRILGHIYNDLVGTGNG